jgi:hypothetical protein
MTHRLTDFRTHQAVLRADFDLLDDDGEMSISLRFQEGPGKPDPGEAVYLLDGRGHGCVADVVAAEGPYVRVQPDWNTWVGGSLPSRVAS